MTDNYYSLSQITGHLQKLITKTYTREYWIKAEISALNFYPKSGHCYPDLVEKSETGIKAQIRAIIWNKNFVNIQNQFKSTTGRSLEDGMEILFRAKLDYNPAYGLSLNISTIDPHFTLGKMASEKLATINKLKSDGVFFSNKVLQMPFFPKRIAVISVETSKGFQDFKKIVDQNTRGYIFFYMLFPALLQGDEAVESIGYQLERIRKVKHHFDLVAIIRGGGGDVGLSCYNDYELARKVATFPIPVISGIGHSTNETVVELVAHKNAITPTDLAYYLQQKFDNIAVKLNEFQAIISDNSYEILSMANTNLHSIADRIKNRQNIFLVNHIDSIRIQRMRLEKYARRFIPAKIETIRLKIKQLVSIPERKLHRKIESLNFIVLSLQKSANHNVKIHWHKRQHLEEKIKLLDPIEVLKKGYTITRFNGKAITSIDKLNSENIIETTSIGGKIESKIIKTTKK